MKTGPGAPRIIQRPSEYKGDDEAVVAATQRENLTATQKRKIVEEWMNFFSSGPSSIKRLEFVSRTPRRLFETLEHQTQLESLEVKWGDYTDLSPIQSMPRLRTLVFHSAPAVTSLEPLRSNTTIRRLGISGLRDAHDMSPLGTMTSLQDLCLGGDGNSLRVAHIDSLDFIVNLPELELLLLHGLIVDSKDYSPLLSLRKLKRAWVMEARGMQPNISELAAKLDGWVH